MPENRQNNLIEIQLLGTFHVTYGGEVLAGLDSPRIQELLTYLLLHRDAPQSRQQIASAFWPESSDRQSRANLRQLLYRLRRLLPEADRYLQVEVSTLQWQVQTSFHLDVACFEDALAQAGEVLQAGQPQTAIAALRKAVGLYQGDLQTAMTNGSCPAASACANSTPALCSS